MHRLELNRYGRRYCGLLAIAILTLSLGACFGGTRSLAPDYYLLTSRLLTSQALTTPIKTTSTFSIGVGPVRVAPFLARQQIVTHAGSGTMNIEQGQRWGEPLEHGIQRVLLQNLAALTGAHTRIFPWRQNTAPDYALRIDVSDLDKLADNTAILEVSWVLEDLKNGKVLTTQQTRLDTAIAGPDAVALANAYSMLFEQLAQRVKAELQKQRGEREL